MKLHELKIDHDNFVQINDGVKRFELRLNDRGFECGDLLRLCETERSAEEMKRYHLRPEYTGRELLVQCTSIMRVELADDVGTHHVIMSIGVLSRLTK